MMGSVRGEEQSLGPRGHVVAVEHELADGVAELGATGSRVTITV